MWLLVVVGVFVAVQWLRWRRSGRPFVEALALGVARFHATFWHRWHGRRLAPLPAKGPFILVANHTCSADPSFLLAGSPRVFGFVSAREHYNAHPLIRGILDLLGCVPVTRNGRDGTAARAALRRLAEGRALCLFPEGGLHGVAQGRLRPAKAGAAFLALCSRAPVYPAYIAGGPRTDDILRAWLWPSGKVARVTYGPAIDLSAYYDRPRDRRLLAEVTTLFMDRIRDLQRSAV
jgi:1-acyl-sn-glycerol-3-phosphate acyltransferase